MSVELESKLSATIELTQWVASILAASVYRCVWDNIVSNLVLIVATSLACLLGTVVYYKKDVCAVSDARETAVSTSPEIETVKITTTIDSAPIMVSKMTAPANKDSFPCIDLVPTDDVESDSDNSEEDYKEDWNEDDYTLRFSAPTNNLVSDTDDNGTSNDDKYDKEDWNEEDYKDRFSVSKPTTRAPKKEIISQSRSASKPKTTTTTRASKPKESLSQMRKRVAREMKEAEERQRQRLSGTSTRAAPASAKLAKRVSSAKTAPISTRPTRKKETVAEMKARVAREFAAKLKK